jgi:hypothetical protein
LMFLLLCLLRVLGLSDVVLDAIHLVCQI